MKAPETLAGLAPGDAGEVLTLQRAAFITGAGHIAITTCRR